LHCRGQSYRPGNACYGSRVCLPTLAGGRVDQLLWPECLSPCLPAVGVAAVPIQYYAVLGLSIASFAYFVAAINLVLGHRRLPVRPRGNRSDAEHSPGSPHRCLWLYVVAERIAAARLSRWLRARRHWVALLVLLVTSLIPLGLAFSVAMLILRVAHQQAGGSLDEMWVPRLVFATAVSFIIPFSVFVYTSFGYYTRALLIGPPRPSSVNPPSPGPGGTCHGPSSS
jgi:hypothetical protein